MKFRALFPLLIAFATPPATAQELSDYFGFEGLEIIKIDALAGPMIAADMNGDDLTDLIVINNRKSRIEIHYQKRDASPEDAEQTVSSSNEFPEHWRFRREPTVVNHHVGAVVAHDYDEDGLNDLIYVGRPSEIVLLRQVEPGVFRVARTHRLKELAANKDALAVANVVGDDRPELITIAEGKIEILSLADGRIAPATTLAAGEGLVAFWADDFNGDGRFDIAAALPDNPAPLRLWLGGEKDGSVTLGAQLRFEMPPLVEVEPLRLPGESRAKIALIERPSKRVVITELAREEAEDTGDRHASIHVHSFTDPGNRTRDIAIADLDGDGMLDLISTDTEASAISLYRQTAGTGLERGERHPSFADITSIAAGNVDDDPQLELFVLSEKESVVGRSDVDGDQIPFPSPIPIPEGKTPVAMNLAMIDGEPHLTVVVKDGREYALAIIKMTGEMETIALGSASRSPDSIVALDADQDGRTDLLLLTRDKPMQMIHRTDDGFVLRESKDMGQFGIVQAATSRNTSIYDIDGDGGDELLIADRNFVRAVRYEPDPAEGVSPGWQVVRQMNAREPDSKVVAVTVLDGRIVAADQERDRLIIFKRDEEAPGGWAIDESIYVSGFELNDIYAGAFSGHDEPGILAIGDDGFATIRLTGERYVLRETNTWRTDVERRFQHELTAGDANSDGFTDLVMLDAGEQMLEILTFSEAGNLLYATGFQVFESRMFTGGEIREYEPSQCIIADVTGDGANDLVLTAHDRVLIYPQATTKR